MECSLAFYAAVRGGTGDSRDDRSCWVAWNHMTLSPMLFVLSASPIVARAGEFGVSKGDFGSPSPVLSSCEHTKQRGSFAMVSIEDPSTNSPV